ncbi:hypothetical protein TCAL_09954 [Tigriopus californicus]|uniref:L-Fucosyltransferase n=2 Tax=Tigriopus californicus TaxID=6832 RepID=A0A553P310_TIGCA|nr:hypothetical protein TCAL_09954 [Tigriopus californicus]|eukprot:TCALIF_09954-PA protein Name:"Similar to FUT1 Galactoside 2-alpha-L-fucosyltransferase 1 (Saguinus fuscicollis)" AED:0.05 eAED:0.05 QI:0/1/0.5/1/0/0.5/2/47/335
MDAPKILNMNLWNELENAIADNRTECRQYLALTSDSSWLDLMTEYATFLSFVYQKQYKGYLVVSDQVRNRLIQFFPNVSLPGISDLPCHFEPVEVVKDISMTNDTFDRVTAKSRRAANLVLENQPGKFSVILVHRKVMRYEFQFHATYDQVVKRSLHIVDRNRPMISKDRPRVFVGVQIKRLDVNSNEEWLSSKEYYFKAMEMFRARYGRNCVFILSSDDLLWAHNCFSELSDVVFTDQIAKEHVPAKIFDFMVLTQCNHTIVSHGSLGIWGAFLGDGDVIAPDSVYFGTPSLIRTIMASGFFSNWQTIIDPSFISNPNKILVQHFENLLPNSFV